MNLRIVHFSDTHCKHIGVEIPEGDVLVYTGDVSNNSSQWEVELFFRWWLLLPHRYKIFVPGNHDRCFDVEKDKFKMRPFWVGEILKNVNYDEKHSHFLIDQECIIEGVKFWGSPYAPVITHGNTYWGFMEERHHLKYRWMNIPKDVDVLLTHGPAYGKLDEVETGELVGCKYLRWHINEKKPKIHMFGHVHESYGMTSDEDTLYLNSSVVDKKHILRNSPQEVEINTETKETCFIYQCCP